MEKGLVPTLKLSLEMTNVLARTEQVGLKINMDTLDEIEQMYTEELETLEVRLNELAREAMGDTPVSLTSPDDRSMLLYSRKVKDKKDWSRTFNLGMEQRGATMKPKQRTRFSQREFNQTIRRMTDIVYKTRAETCPACKGHGRTRVVKKDGTLGKAVRVCRKCDGKGVLYIPTSTVAGFKMSPRDSYDVASAGFRTDKDTLDGVLSNCRVTHASLSRGRSLQCLRTCLNTFVEGINNVDSKGYIHPEFMQCVTATGRLSSRVRTSKTCHAVRHSYVRSSKVAP